MNLMQLSYVLYIYLIHFDNPTSYGLHSSIFINKTYRPTYNGVLHTVEYIDLLQRAWW